MTDHAWRSRVRSPHDAIDLLRDGDRVILPTGVGEPPALLEALSDRRRELRGVVVHQCLALRTYDYFDPETADHVRHSALFLGSPSRAGASEGWVDWIPNTFADLPRMIRDGSLPVDVVCALVSPPDEQGRFALGVGTDYTLAAIERARTVIVEVNPHVPWTHGDCHIPLERVDAIVTDERPLTELPPATVGPVEQQIGELVADMIPDGATLQIGIGAIPDAVVGQLTDRSGLGIHTEMMGNGILRLIESGAVDNRGKQQFPGVSVATFALGGRRLYEWMDHNPAVHLHPVDITNDPYLAGSNPKLHTINAAIEIDLFGQVCAESIGPAPYSGAGGQVDFIRAGTRSVGGKSIVVATSTAKGGTVSRIVPRLRPGAIVTTSKNDIDRVVTEYGVAELRGRSWRQRAEALIAIAHPDFRDELAASLP